MSCLLNDNDSAIHLLGTDLRRKKLIQGRNKKVDTMKTIGIIGLAHSMRRVIDNAQIRNVNLSSTFKHITTPH